MLKIMLYLVIQTIYFSNITVVNTVIVHVPTKTAEFLCKQGSQL